MASLSDFRRVADDVRNWGRWGDADELGTLNLITADKTAQDQQREAYIALAIEAYLNGLDDGV